MNLKTIFPCHLFCGIWCHDEEVESFKFIIKSVKKLLKPHKNYKKWHALKQYTKILPQDISEVLEKFSKSIF